MKKDIFFPITRYRHSTVERKLDSVAVEEPLEIFVDGVPYYLTMRFPGEEKELAVGHIFTDGIIESLKDINVLMYCSEESGNRVDILLNPPKKNGQVKNIKEWSKPAYSSCGICGQDILQAICTQVSYRANNLYVTSTQIQEAITAIIKHQDAFEKTGGTHAAGVFDNKLQLLSFAEDIGRHNALDKALGKLLLEEKTDQIGIVALTSRLSYEMVQKVCRTKAEILIGMSSPTSLGLNLAERVNLTVIGFARQCQFNIYTGTERIIKIG